MPDETKPLSKITEWRGMASNGEPRHLPLGAAQLQKNLQSIVPGRVTCRGGLQPTAFNTFEPGSDVIGLYTYQVHGKDYVVYEATDSSDDGAGTIMAGEGTNLRELVTDYFNDAFRVSFAKSRHNSLIMVNGVDRGKMWDGDDVGTDKAVELGIDPPAAAPSVDVGTAAFSGGATAGDYICYYRYVSRDADPLFSNLSPVKELSSVLGSRQFKYTGLSSTFQNLSGSGRVRFVEIYRSTAGQSTAVYLIKKLGYDGSVTNITTSGNTYIVTSKDHGLAIGAKVLTRNVTASLSMSTDLSGSGSAYFVTVVADADTFTIDSGSGTSGTYTSGGDWVVQGFGDSSIGNIANEDAFADTALNATAVTTPATALRILNPDGSLNANRHTVPPFHMSVAVQFQDRMFYAVPVRLDEGTCSTQGSTTIDTFSEKINSTITGEQPLKDRYITINDSSETRSFKITDQPSKTSLTVDRTALTNTDLQTYVIEAATTERRKVYYSEADLPESVPTANDTIIQENTGDDDDMTGLMPHGSFLYGLFERNIYRSSFVRQPQLDIQWTLVASRGCFNQACWDRYADLAFLMDQSGPYIITLISPIPKVIGEEIMDFWRDCIIDFSKSKWFFTKVDPVLQVVRFHVCYKADNSTRPKRAICYHWPSGAWWEEGYPIELGGATTVAIAGQLRTVVGGEDELLLLTHEGTTDRITAEISNVMDSATSTVITDTTNTPFSASPAQVGGTVAIIAGLGKGQHRTITSHTTSALTTAAWETTPDSTSRYLVGAIPYEYKSSQFEFPVSESREQRKLGIVFKPTRNASTLELRHYLNDQLIPRFGTITSSAISSTFIQFTVPQNHGLIAGAKFAVLGSSEATDNVTHTVTSVTATTVLTATTHSSDGAGGNWELVSSGLAELHTPGQKSGDGVEIDTDTFYPVIDLQISRSGLGNQAGFAQMGFSGNRPEGTQAARYITAEIQGFQGDDAIVISELSVGGAG